MQTDDDDLYTLLNALRPDVILDKKTFKEMQEPNAEINAAARLIRHQANNWRSESAEHLTNAAQTSWGRSVIAENPTYKNVMAQLKGGQTLDRTARIGILHDVEGLHSFAGMINRTRDRIYRMISVCAVLKVFLSTLPLSNKSCMMR